MSTDTTDMTLADAYHRLRAGLPEGWEFTLTFLDGVATGTLTSPDGRTGEFDPGDHGGDLGAAIEAAIRTARGEGEVEP